MFEAIRLLKLSIEFHLNFSQNVKSRTFSFLWSLLLKKVILYRNSPIIVLHNWSKSISLIDQEITGLTIQFQSENLYKPLLYSLIAIIVRWPLKILISSAFVQTFLFKWKLQFINIKKNHALIFIFLSTEHWTNQNRANNN